LALLSLRGMRKPAVGVVHGIVGTLGLLLLVIALQGPRRGDAMGTGSFGVTASVLIGIALACGLSIPLWSNRSPRFAGVTIATHASLAIAGFVLFLAWASNG
jgi:hypothetical protein